ncbi:MAG: hypothetical protein Q9165_008473 [Trypethelium subeluteriae]
MQFSALILAGITALIPSVGGAALPAAKALGFAGINNAVVDMNWNYTPTRVRRGAHISRSGKASAIVSATNVPTGNPLVLDPRPDELAMHNASLMFGWQLVAGSTQHEVGYLCIDLGAYSDMWVAMGFDVTQIQAALCQASRATAYPDTGYIDDQIRAAASNVYLSYVLNSGKPKSTTFWASACQGLLPQLLDAIDLNGNDIHTTICNRAGIPATSIHPNTTIPHAISSVQSQASLLYAYLLVGSWKLPNDPSTYCATVDPNSPSSADTRASFNATKMLNADKIAQVWCALAAPGAPFPSIGEVETNITMAISGLFTKQLANTIDPGTTYVQYLRDNMLVMSLDWEGLNGTEVWTTIQQMANGD